MIKLLATFNTQSKNPESRAIDLIRCISVSLVLFTCFVGVGAAQSSSSTFDEDSENSPQVALGQTEYEALILRIEELTAELTTLRSAIQKQEVAIANNQQLMLRRYIELDKKINVARAENDPQGDEISALELGTFQVRLQGSITLIEQGEYWNAEKELADLLVEYPDASDVALAWFWLGEVQIAGENLTAAEQTLSYLIAAYPEHWKVPAASYRLGEIHRLKGDLERARTQYVRVVENYPESAAARLSELAINRLFE